MKHEKIIVRESGLKVKISVELTIDWRETYWTTIVETCQPGKRKWINVHDSENYSYRRLDLPGRDKDILATQLEHVTEAELNQVKLELWQQLKPI